jgi:hypothetical protein
VRPLRFHAFTSTAHFARVFLSPMRMRYRTTRALVTKAVGRTVTRAANRRHQKTPWGREDHREHQREYRRRRRERRQRSVTDKGSDGVPSSGTVTSSKAPREALARTTSSKRPPKPRRAVLRCAACGCEGHFSRWHPGWWWSRRR